MSHRTTARVVGGLYITASVAGVLALLLLQPIAGTHGNLAEASLNGTRVATGALLELVMGMAVVGIAVTIYPVLRRFGERLALGYVAVRTMEGMLNVIGAIGALVILSLSRELVGAGAPDGSLQTLAGTLQAGGDWVNSAALPIVFALDALILNYVLYRARLVPRWLSAWGLAGAALWLAVGVMVTYGLESSATTALAVPIGVQEMAFAAWLIVKGFDAAAFRYQPEVGPAEEHARMSVPPRARPASGA
jgi:hypothetical protein